MIHLNHHSRALSRDCNNLLVNGYYRKLNRSLGGSGSFKVAFFKVAFKMASGEGPDINEMTSSNSDVPSQVITATGIIEPRLGHR